MRPAQTILKRKFPSIDKPLQIKAPQKGPLKNISPPGLIFGILRYFIQENQLHYPVDRGLSGG